MLPKGTDILVYKNDYLKYIKQIDEYNKKYPQCPQKTLSVDEYLDDFIMKKYAEIADKNAEINEIRRQYIASSLKWLLKGVVLLIFAGFLFLFFDLDLSSPRKPVAICDKSLVLEIKNLNSKLEKLMGRIAMIDKKTTNDSKPINQITEIPEPPKEPDVRVSTEDLKPKIEKDTMIITEDK